LRISNCGLSSSAWLAGPVVTLNPQSAIRSGVLCSPTVSGYSAWVSIRAEIGMVDVSALVFPASGVLAGWQRQLAARQPQALWVGHLFVLRVEALVQIATQQPLDRGAALILQAVGLSEAASNDQALAKLRDRLHFPEAMLRHELRNLESDGLVDADRIALTAAGRQALAGGSYARPQLQRRSFTFLERWDAEGGRVTPPQYVPAESVTAAPWQAAPPWDDAWLRECIAKPVAWKNACGFPQDVRALADAAPDTIPLWQRVTVLRPEKLIASIAVVPQGGTTHLLAFAVRTSGNLPSLTPFLQLGEEGRAQLPELAPDPTAEDVQTAWLLWCQGHGITSPLAESCPCQVNGLELKVQVPAVLLHELRGGRCELTGQEWLLLGGGAVRRAVQLHVASI
jgi:hypothetical protein